VTIPATVFLPAAIGPTMVIRIGTDQILVFLTPECHTTALRLAEYGSDGCSEVERVLAVGSSSAPGEGEESLRAFK
jgi:hypothetical protein